MTIEEAKSFILPAIKSPQGRWADIGAGTGVFTLALDQLLTSGSHIYAMDKNPHTLYSLQLNNCNLHIEEQDFNRPFEYPEMDGIILANTLHYAEDPIHAMQNILSILKPGGEFILIEYETARPLKPWIPYPVPFDHFISISEKLPLSAPKILVKRPSAYGHDHIYLAKAEKL